MGIDGTGAQNDPVAVNTGIKQDIKEGLQTAGYKGDDNGGHIPGQVCDVDGDEVATRGDGCTRGWQLTKDQLS